MNELKFDRVYAGIDLDNISHNLRCIKGLLRPGVPVMAVLKADAYGHGARVVANFIKDEIAMAGVAGVSEALELRKEIPGGEYYSPAFKKPVLVLGYTHRTMFRDAVENDVTLTVFDYDNAAELDAVARSLGKIAEVHVAVDTGMHRIGVTPDAKGVALVKSVAAFDNIKIRGIFSHFAMADEKHGTAAVEEQERLLGQFVDAVRRENIDPGIVHISNSAGIIRKIDGYDMVRAGIVLYGRYPSEEVDKAALPLKPSLSVRTRVVNVAPLRKGEGISYGHTFVADKDYLVATLAAGYADGIMRSLSGKGSVLIGGRLCPILGRICMDQMMVDVSSAGDVRVGDEAVIFGTERLRAGGCSEIRSEGCSKSCPDGASGGEVSELPIEAVAALCGSFNYELMCEIGRRMNRIYFKDGVAVENVSYI